MDGNKDEAEKCIELGRKYFKEKNKEKAEKFLQKAERLYPTKEAKDLLTQLNFLAPSMEPENLRQRKPPPKQEKPAAPEFTTEQQDAVKRIKKCKDYYEILSVSKDASDSEIKKAYKKLALQLHPDKNKCPGAVEAFKVIGNAVAILTDVEKRKQYDLYGSEEERLGSRSARHANSYSRGFEAEETADELFKMFFDGFANSNIYVRRAGRWQRQNANHESSHREQQNSYTVFLQILPLLLAILLSMASSLFISDPAYSLQMTAKYPIERQTTNLRIPYYVKENFHNDYQGSVKRLEVTIEEEYLANLRHACFREKNYRDTMIWKARNLGDPKLFQDAQNMRMPSCERIQNMRNHG